MNGTKEEKEEREGEGEIKGAKSKQIVRRIQSLLLLLLRPSKLTHLRMDKNQRKKTSLTEITETKTGSLHQKAEGTLPRRRQRGETEEWNSRKTQEECGILRCNAKLLSTRGSKSTRQTFVVSRSRRDIPRGMWTRGVLTRRYGPVFFFFFFFLFCFSPNL